MKYTKITIAIQKENRTPIMEIIDFKNNYILLRNMFNQYQVSFPKEKMAEIKMIADVCKFEEWEKNYYGKKPVVEWQIQIFDDDTSVMDSFGKNGVPECWDLFEEILKYCKLLVEKYSPDYRDPNKMPGLFRSTDEDD